MSSHHEEHLIEGPKPVSFTVPFILACVALLIMFLFLSLCDPKHGHEGAHHEANAMTHGHEATQEKTAGHAEDAAVRHEESAGEQH